MYVGLPEAARFGLGPPGHVVSEFDLLAAVQALVRLLEVQIRSVGILGYFRILGDDKFGFVFAEVTAFSWHEWISVEGGRRGETALRDLIYGEGHTSRGQAPGEQLT